MNVPAFYLPATKWSKVTCLDRQDAAHANVLRLSAGSGVALFDGEGVQASGRVIHMRKKTVEIELLDIKETPPPKSRAIMAIALSKAARRGFFMEKAAELGAWGIWLWEAQRSQGKLTPSVAQSCESQLIAGLKQSRNPWLPKLSVFADIHAVAERAIDADRRILPWEAQSGIPMLGQEELGREGLTIYVIGPEGGFADDEINCLKAAGFCTVSLGARVLRCETAATLCLGLHWWASQLPGHPDWHSGAGA